MTNLWQSRAKSSSGFINKVETLVLILSVSLLVYASLLLILLGHRLSRLVALTFDNDAEFVKSMLTRSLARFT